MISLRYAGKYNLEASHASASTAAQEITMANAADNANIDEQFRYMWNRRAAIQLRALSNRIYYQERQRIFETREGIIKVIAILGGSLAFSRIADAELVQWCAAAITISTAASLVFGFGTKARDSAKRSSKWTKPDSPTLLSFWRRHCPPIVIH